MATALLLAVEAPAQKPEPKHTQKRRSCETSNDVDRSIDKAIGDDLVIASPTEHIMNACPVDRVLRHRSHDLARST